MPHSHTTCHRAGCRVKKTGRGDGFCKTIDWLLDDETVEKRELWFCSMAHLHDWKTRKETDNYYKHCAFNYEPMTVTTVMPPEKIEAPTVEFTNPFADLPMDE